MVITRHFLTLPASGGKLPRKVHYRRCGTGPALLMVHQSPRSSAEYEDLMREWGEHFTCIAPDSPGFGQSDPLPGHPEIVDFADALVEFVGALGLERCAAYGFHSGAVIAVTALKRHPNLFSCLAAGGYAVWSKEEIAAFGDDYLPPFQPSAYGEHLTWLWNRALEQTWFFPWFLAKDEARLSVAHADPVKTDATVRDLLDAGDAYRAGYGAVLRAKRDIPPPNADMPPVLITAFASDPLEPHIDRLGEMPKGWEARKVASPEDQNQANLDFFRKYADDASCPDLAEDQHEGWLQIDGGLIHWKGERGGRRVVLHRPAGELEEPENGNIAIDAPGHGLSSPLASFETQDIAELVTEAAHALGADEVLWPKAPVGEAEQLYPDLTPDRYGAYLIKAWSAARAEAIFAPWYEASAANAIAIDDEDLALDAIARRCLARLRACDAARSYHHTLTSLETN